MLRFLFIWLVAASGALAETRSEPLVRMLSSVPQATVTEMGPRVLIHFGDRMAGQAVLARWMLQEQRLDEVEALSLARSMPRGLIDAYARSDGAAWPELVGFAGRDINQLLELTAGQDRLTLIDLVDAYAVPDALVRNGYQGEGLIWVRGEEDFGMNLALRNPSNPFGGSLGQHSRILLSGNRLAEAGSRARLAGLGDDGPRLDAHPEVAGLAAALEDPVFEGFRLVRAWLMPSLAELKPGARPGWIMAADLSDGVETLGLLMIVMTSQSWAERDAALVQSNWADVQTAAGRGTFEEAIGPVEVGVIATEVPVLYIARRLAIADRPAGTPMFVGDPWGMQVILMQDLGFLP